MAAVVANLREVQHRYLATRYRSWSVHKDHPNTATRDLRSGPHAIPAQQS